MRQIDIRDFLPDILTFAPYCPEPVALRYLRMSARKLCETAPLWRDQDEIIIDNHAATGLCTLIDAAIVRIDRARLNGADLQPKSVAWLDSHHPDWQNDKGTARFITQLGPDQVQIVPHQPGKLSLRLILKPSLDAQTLPSVLEDYRDTLARGAAAHILLSPQEDLANPSLGTALQTEFNLQLERLHRQTVKTQLNAPLRTRPSIF